MHFTLTLQRFVTATGRYWPQLSNAGAGPRIEERRAEIAREFSAQVFCGISDLPNLEPYTWGRYKLALALCGSSPQVAQVGHSLAALFEDDRLKAVDHVAQAGLALGNGDLLVACARAMVEAKPRPTVELKISVKHATLAVIDAQRGERSRALFAAQWIERNAHQPTPPVVPGPSHRMTVALSPVVVAALKRGLVHDSITWRAARLLDNLQH